MSKKVDFTEEYLKRIYGIKADSLDPGETVITREFAEEFFHPCVIELSIC
jgi:hypothetical protein